jgi:BMFP domain-containing protein YqiC
MSALDPELAALIERGHYDPATVTAWSESKRIAAERLASRKPPANEARTSAELAALVARVERLEQLADVLADDLADGLGVALPGIVDQQTVDLKQRLDQLEARASALEDRREVRFRGVHDPDASYQENDFCIRQGSLWWCRRPTTALPGHAPNDWTLAAKAGSVGNRKPGAA